MSRRGFTLIEMVIGLAVFIFVAAASFIFAQTQIRARKQTQVLLDAEQNARVSLDSIKTDLQTAGLGVGYRVDGVFLGFSMGAFGGGAFNSNDFAHADGHLSDDLRIRGALGPARTVAAYDAPAANGTMEVCSGAGFVAGERALLVSESYTDARSVIVTPTAVNVACTQADCVRTGRCDVLSYVDDSAVYESDPSAKDASYMGGTIFRSYYDVVYFIDWTTGQPALYRASMPCASRAACISPNDLLGEGVESLQLRVWEQPSSGGPLVDQTTNPTYLGPLVGGVNSADRVRMDVEIIARSRTEEAETPPNNLCSAVSPAVCLPLGGGQDKYRRRMLTTSVELKNSGHMRFQALR